MTNAELKEAVRTKANVIYDGKIYECVSEIIMYYRNGWNISVTLIEKGVNSIRRVKAEEVRKV